MPNCESFEQPECEGHDETPRRYRVVIADDHKILADMLGTVLQPEFEVIDTVMDGPSLLDATRRLQPDIALIDVIMPGLTGLDAGRQAIAGLPSLKLIYLTGRTDETMAAEAFAIGASAYLLKDCSTAELRRVMRLVIAGGRYLSPSIANGDVNALCERFPMNSIARLSPREREVLTLLVSGQSMKQVARRLGITGRTVAFHKYRAMETLNLRGNPQLIDFALRHGLLDPGTTSQPKNAGGT